MNQFEWEQYALDRGAEKFAYAERTKRSQGLTDETEVGRLVIRQRVLEVSKTLEDMKGVAGRGGAYHAALVRAATRHNGEEFFQDWNLVAYVVLCTVLQKMYSRNDRDKFLYSLASDIGGRLENDQQLYVFEQDNKAFVGTIMASLQAQNVTSYRHKLRTFQKKYRDAEMDWEPWGTVTRLQVGLRALQAVIRTMDDCFVLTKKHNGKHMAYYVDTTMEFDDFVIDQTELRALCMPLSLPLIQEPIPYDRVDGEVTGGYHKPAMRALSPFIKTRGDDHKEFVNSSFPYQHMQAVNNLQRTKWGCNRRVFEVVQAVVAGGLDKENIPHAQELELPPHPGEDADEDVINDWKSDVKRLHGRHKQNAVALMQLKQSLDFLRDIDDDPFWFTYSADFRGRLYCNSPLASMQGEDHLKGMIRFHEGKPLGQRGMYWLAINGANKYGYDKVGLADRVRWVVDNEQSIQSLAENPLTSSSRSFLMGADKPYQFLAFAFEWVEAGCGRDYTYCSHLPVGLDGSCNGLQHFAAMLRDPVGGRSVNLVPAGDVPADIYTDVAERVRQLLSEQDTGDPDAVPSAPRRGVLDYPVDRKLTKRPVMTLPYGATQQSCRQYTREYIADHARQFGLHPDDDKGCWEASSALTPIIWAAIKDCVTGARVAMDWLQAAARIANRHEVALRWHSPAGFPIYQPYQKYEQIRIATSMFGDTRIRVTGRGEADGIDGVRAANGIAPNFIHGMDSSHMVFTINAAMQDADITAMACIHDDYGTYAADTDDLYRIVRETFVLMYATTDWIEVWRRSIEGLHEGIKLEEPPVPEDLDVRQVLDSPFFFA